VLHGNRGEWSEVYVLFRLLGDGEIALVNSDLVDIPNSFFRVERVIRHESRGDVVFHSKDLKVVIESHGVADVMPRDTFDAAANALLRTLLESDGKIVHHASEELLTRIRLQSLKSSASRKGDIGFVVRDPYLGALLQLEMSIKSQLGSPATLFNAGVDATNFRYVARNFCGRIDDLPSHREEKRSPSEFVRTLLQESSQIEYSGMRHEQFERNLRMVDMAMPEILGLMLLEYYGTPISSIDLLTDALIQEDPIQVGPELAPLFYPHKVKCFLADCALGLRTSQPWNGSYAATGGYIIVRSDGSLACIHAFDRNLFQDYLYKSTRLDAPSSSRHNYGFVVDASRNSDGTHDIVFDLNLQVRFK